MKYWDKYRVMMFCLVCVLVVSINPLGASAAQYFVATTGNNSNSGTIGSPFRTLEKAASVMVSGDTMFIRGGTYKRGSGTLNVPSGGGSWGTATIITNYQDEEVIITPFDETTLTGSPIIQYPSGRWWIILDGVILDGLNQEGGKGGGNGFKGWPGNHHLRVINTEIRYTASSAILTAGAHSNEFINLHLHHANHKFASGHPNFSTRNYGIYMDSADNLMQGCDIHHNRGQGIQMYSGHTFKPHNNTFIGNHVHENERYGILLYSGTGAVVANNVVWGNGTNASGAFSSSQDDRYGIYTDWGAHDTLIYNNTMYGNVAGELFLGGNANRVIARNNIMFGNGPGYALRLDSGQTGAAVSHNVIYHTTTSRRVLNNAGAGVKVENSNIVEQNPLFLDEKNSGFHLQPGSPAIGKGIVLNEVKNDFDNVQRNPPYDIGAYVFVGSATFVDTIPPAPPRNVTIQ